MQRCHGEGDDAMVTANAVPELLLHSEVLDSGCEEHIADETDLQVYHVEPAEGGKTGR